MAESRNPSPDQPDGYFVEPEELIRLGGGDAAKGRAKLRLLLADQRERAPINGPVARPENVRLATIRDEPAILDLLLEDVEDNGVHVAPISVGQILKNVQVGTRARGGFCPVIDGDDGYPVAVAVLVTVPWWWSERIYIQDVVIYNSPKGNHPGAGKDLWTYQCWLADQMSESVGHRVYAIAGVTATQRREAKVRMLGRSMNVIGATAIYPSVEKPV